MSENNLEVVRRAYEAFRKRDLAAIFTLLDPKVSFSQSEEVPWGGEYHGVEGAREFVTRLTGAVDSSVTLEQFIHAGEKVAAVGRTHGIARGTGKEFDVPVVHLWTLRAGRVPRFEAYIDNSLMLAALEP